MQEYREDGTIVPRIEVQFGNRIIEVRDPFRTVSQIEDLLVTEWVKNNNLGAWFSYQDGAETGRVWIPRDCVVLIR